MTIKNLSWYTKCWWSFKDLTGEILIINVDIMIANYASIKGEAGLVLEGSLYWKYKEHINTVLFVTRILLVEQPINVTNVALRCTLKVTWKIQSTFLQTSHGSWVNIFASLERASKTLMMGATSLTTSSFPVYIDNRHGVNSIKQEWRK